LQPGKLVEDCDELTEEDKRNILGLNALQFLGKNPDDFAR